MPETDPTGSPPREEASLYAERALRDAMEAGLSAAELQVLLRGGSVTAVLPPRPGEDLAAYADRATSELLTLYLADAVVGPTRAG